MRYVDAPEVQKANRRFLRTVMSAPLIGAEHERELALRWRNDGDAQALHELTTSYLRLVVAIASRYRNYGLSLADLIQEGCIGLMQAAERFEPERIVRFSTYAAWWIRASVQAYILRNWSIVRVGTTASQKALFFNLRRLRAQLDRGIEPRTPAATRAEIARLLRVDDAEVANMEALLSAGDLALDAPVGGERSKPLLDALPDDAPLPEDQVIATEDGAIHARWIAHAFERLTPREAAIVHARRMMDETFTLERLGAVFAISKERVRQIELGALRKMKESVLAAASDEGSARFAGH